MGSKQMGDEKESMIDQAMWDEAMQGVMEYEQEIERKRNRIAKAIRNQIGEGFYKDLMDIVEEDECNGEWHLVNKPVGHFQEEYYFGCIPGVWIDQYSVGDSGDSFAGTVTVKLKNGMYLEMSFSC